MPTYPRVLQQARTVDPTATYAGIFTTVGTGDETTTVQAYLDAPSPLGIKRVVGSATITASLIVKSGVYYDFSSATISAQPGTHFNLLQNTAVATVNRTVTDAAITSGQATLTSATANFTTADTGRSVVVAGALASVSGAAGPLCATMTYVNSTTVTLSASATATVSGASASIYDRDSNITIVGGTWIKGAGNASDGVQRHMFRFRRVDKLRLRQCTFNSTSGKYAVSLGSVSDVIARDLSFSVFSDGIHLEGDCRNVLADGLVGSCGDDAIALTARSAPLYAQYEDVAGDITDVIVTNVFAQSVTASVKIIGGTGTKIRRVLMDNIMGAGTEPYCVSITDDGSGPTDLDDCRLRGIRINGNMAPVKIAGTAIKELRLEDVTSGGNLTAGIGVVNIFNGAVVDTLVIEGGYQTGNLPNSNQPYLMVNAGGTVSRVLMTSVSALVSNSGYRLVEVDGTCTDLILRNIQVTPGASSSVVQLGSAGSVARLTISGCHMNGGGQVVHTPQSGSTLTSVALSDIQTTGTSWLAAFATTTELSLSNIKCANSIFEYATGVVTVRGAGLRGITGTPSITAGGSLRLQTTEFPIDVSNSALAKNAGDAAYNTNASLGVGVGQVVCDGTQWRRVDTGTVKSGTATLVAGTVTVSDAAITANSVIRLAYKTVGGTPGSVYVSARSAGASFTITSTQGSDTSVIQYYIDAY